MDFASAFNFLTEFGCGYVLLGCFSRILNFLGMFLIFGFCLKALRFGWHAKSLICFLCDYRGIPRIRLCLEDRVREASKSKAEKGRGSDPLKSPAQNATSPIKRSSHVSREKWNANSEDGSENEREVINEDEVFDAMALRKLVKMERRKANAAWSDLEKERTAAASSAEEAMAMILRLQNEKSAAEIEANQFRRMAEGRLEYDQEVIEELQWMITQHEIQKSLLEEQLGVYKEELKLFVREEEINELEVDVDSGVVESPEINELEVDVDSGGIVEDDPDDHSVISSPETESQTL